jgi:hypothetical protein
MLSGKEGEGTVIFFDTETCGYHGPIVTIQYAVDDGPIKIHHVWYEPINATIKLIEWMVDHRGGVCGFNLAFDWFHICQLYTTLLLLKESADYYLDDPDAPTPMDLRHEYAICEEQARFSDVCLKPYHAFDLMLHARKGEFQKTMARKNIVIKKIPVQIADQLAAELSNRIKMPDIMFAKKQDKKKRWQVDLIELEGGEVDTEFRNVSLKFNASGTLKHLYAEMSGDETVNFNEIMPDGKPEEYGYAPFALAVGEAPGYGRAWPVWIKMYAAHWKYFKPAIEYAENDVKYTRYLYHAFGCPDVDDFDSILACQVGATRWHGFAVDVEAIIKLRDAKQAEIDLVEWNFNSVDVCKRYIAEKLDPTEMLAVQVDGKTSTKAVILEELATWSDADVCDHCDGFGCFKCDHGGLIDSDRPHPVATRAREILDFRQGVKEIQVYDKLIRAKRFHASFVVIGAKSYRMSGTDGLNPQGINHAKFFRECFTLADEWEILAGGDLDASQIAISDAVYGCPKLHAELLAGKKIYPIFGEYLFPGKSYDDIIATKDLPGNDDLYLRSKKGVLAMLFGGEEYTLETRVGVSSEAAKAAYQNWCDDRPVWAASRRKYFDMFCSMRQPRGIGTKVEWNEPADYIESIFGFRRYFTLENRTCKALFDLARKVPDEWRSIKGKVIRRDREQTISGAVSSALYAAAFQIQAQNMRAAANHVIQSPEATIVKDIQCSIWSIQPCGIRKWLVRPFNAHDEIETVCDGLRTAKRVDSVVNDTVSKYRADVPLIKMSWITGLDSWAGKKG